MLSQHLRRSLAHAARGPAAHTRVLPAYMRVVGAGALPRHAAARAFSASARRRDEAPRSPFATFVETLRAELRKNRDLQDNVKQLQGDVDRLQDSEAMKRARDAYERARVRTARVAAGRC
jgi:import inner membrane translocase subunit TIM44